MKIEIITDISKIKRITNKSTNILYLKYNKKRAFYSTDSIRWYMSSIERIKGL